MSGHSKWSTIKHKKSLKDQKRGKIFSKLVRQIQVAARKDPNPETNSALRLIIEKAKEANMPSANIERAIKKASGTGKEGQLEEITLEAYGPAGSALLIEAITDNRNRTVSEIKHLVEKNGGHMAEKGSVSWLFEQKLILSIPSSQWNDELELQLIDQGLEDSQESDSKILLLFNPKSEAAVRQSLIESGVKIQSEEFDWQPKNTLQISQDDAQKVNHISELIEEHDDVKAVYTNIA